MNSTSSIIMLPNASKPFILRVKRTIAVVAAFILKFFRLNQFASCRSPPFMVSVILLRNLPWTTRPMSTAYLCTWYVPHVSQPAAYRTLPCEHPYLPRTSLFASSSPVCMQHVIHPSTYSYAGLNPNKCLFVVSVEPPECTYTHSLTAVNVC